MRHLASLALLACCGALSAHAQVSSQDPTAFIPKYSVTLGFNNIRANAPPADCGCFDLNGGFVSASVPVRYWLSAAAEVTGGHANDIGPLGQNLTLTTYTVGPQVTWRGTRFVPFGQALFGAAHGSDSYFPNGGSYSSTATSFAFTAGGGLDYHLSHRFAIRAFEAQYLHTGFPNAANNGQSHLMLTAGIVFKFHGRYAQPSPESHHPKPQPAPPAHQPIPAPVPSPAPAAMVPSPPPAPIATATPATPVTHGPTTSPSDLEFHSHIRDIFFDYDSAKLRPEAQQSIQDAVSFMKTHPDVRLSIVGYADERGTVEYNFELSKHRAEAAAHAILSAGIPEARIRVVSFGKTVEVCTESDETCWQRNRRAEFSPAR